MTSLEDTQPRSPFKQPPQQQQPYLTPEPEVRAPGCAVWGAIATLGILLALAIVGLAAAAGWTSGVRVAQGNATATHNADIDAQIILIRTDVAAANLPLLQVRVEYLATQTPAIAQVAQLQQTATALYLTRQPTTTPTPIVTVETVETAESAVDAVSTQEAAPTSDSSGGYNLLALLDDARVSVREQRWEDAIETLDTVMSIDPQFEKTTVEGLMSEALNARALFLFRNGESGLAEAIALTNRAELYGPLVGDVGFEREVATLYLDAKARVNTNDYAGGIRLLNQVIGYSENYLDAKSLLMQQYVGYGDALNTGGQPCQAVQQYDLAIAMGSGEASGKRVGAQITCEQGTPTPQGFVATVDPNNPAPIGQP